MPLIIIIPSEDVVIVLRSTGCCGCASITIPLLNRNPLFDFTYMYDLLPPSPSHRVSLTCEAVWPSSPTPLTHSHSSSVRSGTFICFWRSLLTVTHHSQSLGGRPLKSGHLTNQDTFFHPRSVHVLIHVYMFSVSLGGRVSLVPLMVY